MSEGTRANKPYKPTEEEKKATNELYKKWGMKPPFTEKARVSPRYKKTNPVNT